MDMPFRTMPFTHYVRTYHIQSNDINSLCKDTSYTERNSFTHYFWTLHIQSKTVIYTFNLLGHLIYMTKLSFFHYAWTAHTQSKNVIYPLYLATSYTKENVIYPLCLDTSYTEQKCHLSIMLGHLIHIAKMSIMIHYAWTPHIQSRDVIYPL